MKTEKLKLGKLKAEMGMALRGCLWVSVFCFQLSVFAATGPSGGTGGPTNGITATTATNIAFAALQGSMSNVVWVSKGGNDATGSRQFGRPFASPLAAKDAAIAGDTIAVLPGRYTNSAFGTLDRVVGLLKDQVNWYFYPGAEIAVYGDVTDLIVSQNITIFSDTNGPVRCRIMGSGRFYGHVLCDGAVDFGLFNITNAGSDITIEADRISGISQNSFAFNLIYVRNCSNLVVRANVIEPDQTETTLAVTPGSYCNAIYWNNGNMSVAAERIGCSIGSAIWANNLLTGAQATNSSLWVKANLIVQYTNGFGLSYSPIFVSATNGTMDYKVYVTCEEIAAGGWGQNVGAVTQVGGKLYITAQKLGLTKGGSYAIGQYGGTLWADIQKIALSVNSPAIIQGTSNALSLGSINASIHEIEDTTNIVSSTGMTLNGTNVISVDRWITKRTTLKNVASGTTYYKSGFVFGEGSWRFDPSIVSAGNITAGGALVASNLAGSKVLVSDQSTIVESGVSDAELDYLSGVTAPIQTQLSNDVRVAAGANVTVTPSGSGGIMTYTVASTGGGGGTALSNLTTDVRLVGLFTGDTLSYGLDGFWHNFQAYYTVYYTLTIVGSNFTVINVGTNMEQSVAIQTTNSFGLVYSGTPLPGEKFHAAVFNTNPVLNIYMTNNSYNTLVASNVQVYLIPSNSIASFTFVNRTNWNNAGPTNRWELDRLVGKEMELAVAGGAVLETNSTATTVTVRAGNYSTNSNGDGYFLGDLYSFGKDVFLSNNVNGVAQWMPLASSISGTLYLGGLDTTLSPANVAISATNNNQLLFAVNVSTAPYFAPGASNGMYDLGRSTVKWRGVYSKTNFVEDIRATGTVAQNDGYVTNGVGYQINVVSGAGNGNTNYTIQAGITKSLAGSSNINITAVMGGVAGLSYFPQVTFTNLSGIIWGFGVSSVTNSWHWMGPNGTNPPTFIPAGFELNLALEVRGTTNIVAGWMTNAACFTP